MFTTSSFLPSSLSQEVSNKGKASKKSETMPQFVMYNIILFKAQSHSTLHHSYVQTQLPVNTSSLLKTIAALPLPLLSLSLYLSTRGLNLNKVLAPLCCHICVKLVAVFHQKLCQLFVGFQSPAGRRVLKERHRFLVPFEGRLRP